MGINMSKDKQIIREAVKRCTHDLEVIHQKYIECRFTSLNNDEIKHIRTYYKVVDVDWLDASKVNYQIFDDEYFKKSPQKNYVINNMVDFYLNDKDKGIYKKTDYLCNEKEKICICNIHADDFRKIYDGINYKQNKKYISWCKKYKDKF
jgi:hypothetical protein